MEKDVQHAAVASIEMTEPGERPGLPPASDPGGALTPAVYVGFTVWLEAGVGEGPGAGWLANADVSGLTMVGAAEAVPGQPAGPHMAMDADPE